MPLQSPGWYGKLSSQGDFASRRLPDAWLRTVDDWLCAAISASRVQLGARWQALYLNAPVWRFAFAPGVVDTQWWFGVLMPSCDNVGRYFPLVVAQSRSQAPGGREGLAHLDAWWGWVARAALSTLAEGSTVVTFEAELQAGPLWPEPDAATTRAAFDPGSVSGGHGVLPGRKGVEKVVSPRVAGRQTQSAPLSFWWASGAAGRLDPEVLGSPYTASGLPPVDAFTRMLDGSLSA